MDRDQGLLLMSCCAQDSPHSRAIQLSMLLAPRWGNPSLEPSLSHLPKNPLILHFSSQNCMFRGLSDLLTMSTSPNTPLLSSSFTPCMAPLILLSQLRDLLHQGGPGTLLLTECPVSAQRRSCLTNVVEWAPKQMGR